MTLDDTDPERVASLAKQAEQVVNAQTRARKAVAPCSGADQTGTVTATVDERGRVSDLALGRNWREDPGVDGFGQAVVQAAESAANRRQQAIAEAMQDVPEAPAGPGHLEERTDAGKPSREVRRQRVEEALRLLADLDRELPHIRAAGEQLASAEHRGRAENMRVVLGPGGQLSAVSVRPRFLERATDLELRTELFEALKDAYQQRAQANKAERPGQALIERARSLTGGPHE